MMEQDKTPKIKCRVKASARCYDGKPVNAVYEDSMEDDSTFDGETVCCDACYIAIGTPTNPEPWRIGQ